MEYYEPRSRDCAFESFEKPTDHKRRTLSTVSKRRKKNKEKVSLVNGALKTLYLETG